MVMDTITDVCVSPLTEVITQIIDAIIQAAISTDNALIQKKSFAELSSYLNRILPLLRELKTKDIDSEGLITLIEILNRETKTAKQLITECSERNRLYLFLNSRSIAKRIKHITLEISHAMTCVPFASLDISYNISEDMNRLVNNMQNAEFKTAVDEEAILEKIESMIHERNVDRAYANALIFSIAKAVGVSTDRSTLKKEFEEFRSEIENLRLRKDKAEAIQMDQIIALLERADAGSTLKDREKKYLTKRKSLGLQPLEPLDSFYCQITKQVMVDPVETPLGHTFERSAIEKWLSESTDKPFCPVTLTPLDITMLRPNKTLRQSIEEWNERNTMIIVASLKSKLRSVEEEEVICCLEQLEELCRVREIHREWLILENYIPSLIELLHVKNRDIRIRVLSILGLLAKDNDDAKERIAKVENAMRPIVQSLGRNIKEGKLAVSLLLELSKCEFVRESIGHVQGSILLLVTMSSNSDSQAANDAKNILENLSFRDDNVILMAKNNFFIYLLQRLSTGPDHVKMTMAKNLGEMEFTDLSKSSLVEGGVLDSLLVLVSHEDVEMKIAAIKALLNLSSLKKNGQEIIKKGAVRPFLNILYRQTSSPMLRELVAATIVNLALSTVPEESDFVPDLMLESDEDIVELFSLISLTSPAVQQHILRAFHAMCQSALGANVKSKLRQCSAVPVLFQLCKADDTNLRSNAIKLICYLTEDCDETATLEHITRDSIETLLKIIKTSHNEEEISSSMGTIANLPNSTQIEEWLLESTNLPIIFNFLTQSKINGQQSSNRTVENAVRAIRRLTLPTNLQLQKKVAESDMIPLLVQFLEAGNTSLTKTQAAISLAQLSMTSPRLSRQISRRHGFLCFSALPDFCPVHLGNCTVQSSFCLLEAGAIAPLVRVLSEEDDEACEAALDALLTLIIDERLQSGCKILDEANAIPLIIRLIVSPRASLQVKVLNSLERIFRLVEYKQRYGHSAQMPLVDLTQRGDAISKSLAARILARLGLLHDQSSFF